MKVPITEKDKKLIDPQIENFIKLINTLPDNAKAYVFMEFVKRNDSEMRRLRDKFK